MGFAFFNQKSLHATNLYLYQPPSALFKVVATQVILKKILNLVITEKLIIKIV